MVEDKETSQLESSQDGEAETVVKAAPPLRHSLHIYLLLGGEILSVGH